MITCMEWGTRRVEAIEASKTNVWVTYIACINVSYIKKSNSIKWVESGMHFVLNSFLSTDNNLVVGWSCAVCLHLLELIQRWNLTQTFVTLAISTDSSPTFCGKSGSII